MSPGAHFALAVRQCRISIQYQHCSHTSISKFAAEESFTGQIIFQSAQPRAGGSIDWQVGRPLLIQLTNLPSVRNLHGHKHDEGGQKAIAASPTSCSSLFRSSTAECRSPISSTNRDCQPSPVVFTVDGLRGFIHVSTCSRRCACYLSCAGSSSFQLTGTSPSPRQSWR